MTRKDYELIAAAIRSTRATSDAVQPSDATLDAATLNLADALAADNPRFDPKRFIAACGGA